MRTKTRTRPATVAGLLLVVPALLLAQPDSAAAEQDYGPDLPGMVLFPATDAQPIGMDAATIKNALKGQNRPLSKMDRAEFLWDYGFSFMAPRHEVHVDDVWLSRFEVTNAQWEIFLDLDRNQGSDAAPPDSSLASLVKLLYTFDADDPASAVDAQRAGLYLYHRNAAVLRPVLNPDDDPKWEPLKAWVEKATIPAGTTIEFTYILPPPYWPEGKLPDAERDLPVRSLSRADARAFCRWAGLHLPREREWERGARGDDGRTYHWGHDWNAEAVVHKGWPGFGDVSGPQPVTSLRAGRASAACRARSP